MKIRKIARKIECKIVRKIVKRAHYDLQQPCFLLNQAENWRTAMFW